MTNKQMQEFDLVIVGGGLVGAALACSLKQTSLRIAIVDMMNPTDVTLSSQAAGEVSAFEPRVSALTSASVELLSELAVWQGVYPDLAQAYEKMFVWDELGTANITFDAAELQRQELGFIVENKHLVAAMLRQLKSQDNLTCFWNASVSSLNSVDSRNIISLGDTKIACDLLVGADGANSRVRQQANLPTREWDYEHQAIVCTVETEKPHLGTARQRFSEAGPLAFLPLKDAESSGHFCSIVWSLGAKEVEQILNMNDQMFAKTLSASIENELGAIKSVSKRFSFPLRQRHAKDYVREGVALIGDAAHTIHPLAGQGVNLGFKDVAVLSRLIIRAHERGLPIFQEQLLKRYQRERQGDNLLMMGAMEGFKRLFGDTDPLARWVRNTGLSFVNSQSMIKNQLAKHAMGL